MKTKFKLLAASVTAIAMALALPVLLFMGPPNSGAATTTLPTQYTPYYVDIGLGAGMASISTGATVTANGTAFTLQKDRGLTVIPRFVQGGAGAQNVTFTFQLSADGVNYTTTGPLSYAVASNGTTPVVGYKVFTATDLGGARYARISQIINGVSQTLTVSGVQIAYWP